MLILIKKQSSNMILGENVEALEKTECLTSAMDKPLQDCTSSVQGAPDMFVTPRRNFVLSFLLHSWSKSSSCEFKNIIQCLTSIEAGLHKHSYSSDTELKVVRGDMSSITDDE